MSHVFASQARNRFAELMHRANNGEEITTTLRGKPNVRIAPAPEMKVHDPVRARLAIQRLREHARAHPVSNVTIEEIKSWIDERRP